MRSTMKIYQYINFVFLGLGLIFWTTDIQTTQFSFFIGMAGTMLLLTIHHYKSRKYSLELVAFLAFSIGILSILSANLVYLAIILYIIIRPPATFLYGVIYSFWLVYIPLLVNEYFILKMPIEFLFAFHQELVIIVLQEWFWLLLLAGYIISVLPHYIGGTKTFATRFHLISGFILFIVTIPIQLLIAIGIGIYKYTRNYVVVFRATVQKQTLAAASLNTQPAFENYWFRRCYNDWKIIFQKTREENKNSKKSLDFTAKRIYNLHDLALGTIPLVVLKSAGFSTVIIGFLILLVTNLVHLVIIGIISIPVFAYYYTFFIYATYFLRANKVATICPSCYHRSELPNYVCFQCNREHTDLRPGRFGIRKRKCLCGTQLPTTTFDDRHQLHAKCENETCRAELFTKEATPFAISVIGAPSSGKTSFIMSAIHQIKEITAPRLSWTIDFLSTKDEDLLNKQSEALARGQYPSKTVEKRPLAYNLKLTSDKWKNPKLLYIYDPAGEAYSNSQELRSHHYLEYIDGYVLMIDPFSLPEVSAKYEQENNQDLVNVKPSAILPEDTYNMLMVHLATKFQVKENVKITVPLAIVINKIDAFHLENEIAATDLPEGTNDKENEQALVNEQCKAFLNNVGYRTLVKQIENKFSTYQFFVSSSANLNEGNKERSSQVITWLMEQK